jgi:hypothetical protein
LRLIGSIDIRASGLTAIYELATDVPFRLATYANISRDNAEWPRPALGRMVDAMRPRDQAG